MRRERGDGDGRVCVEWYGKVSFVLRNFERMISCILFQHSFEKEMRENTKLKIDLKKSLN